jgi:hypothetical protein
MARTGAVLEPGHSEVLSGSGIRDYDHSQFAASSLHASLQDQLETKMLTALVLICSTAITPDLHDCTRENATTVIRLSTEFSSPTACLMYAQTTLANTSIGRDLGEMDQVKIACARIETVDASIPQQQVK